MQKVSAGIRRASEGDLAALAWLRENQQHLHTMVENFRAYQSEQVDGPRVDHLREPEPAAGMPPPLPATAQTAADEITGVTLDALRARPGFRALDRGGFACVTCAALFPTMPESCATCDHARELQRLASIGADVSAARCSVCMTVLIDLDAPCPTCLAAGRSNGSPESLHAAQTAHASPYATSPTVYDTPRLSNAATRAPIPAPPPPPRAYSSAEVCRSCGRIADLHMTHNPPGPLQHVFEPLPQQ